jgi:hypothetical protein
MRKTITDAEFWDQLASYEQSAWRFEQQPSYAVDYESKQFTDFLAGQPQPPTENPELGAWMRQVAQQVSDGKTMGRVRIVDDPITDYQRWMKWMDRWNREAGEVIDYLTRGYAVEVGLLPAASPADWWLFDDSRLMLMHFNADGVRTSVELVEDDPQVAEAIEFRRAAIAAARAESCTSA